MEFPRWVFTDSTKELVKNESEYNAAIEAGYFSTITEANEYKNKPKEKDELVVAGYYDENGKYTECLPEEDRNITGELPEVKPEVKRGRKPKEK